MLRKSEKLMEQRIPLIPWHTPALWQEANAALGHAIESHHEGLTKALRLADELHKTMASVFPHMEHLCSLTCPSCQAVCCRVACIWMDFRDLLFLHLAGIEIPEAQPIPMHGETCRHLGPKGCGLDRIQRPFVCTYYLCPAQTQFMRQSPALRHDISNGIQRAKTLRNDMEDHFIAVIL